MRGTIRQQAAMFSYLSPEQRVPMDHPLRPIRQMVDAVLRGLSPQFDALYARTGRPSIPPEKLLRALLVQLLYSVRSERQLMEQLDYNLLFRWFVGLNMDDPVWDATVFTKNRERWPAGDIAQGFFDHVLAQAYARTDVGAALQRRRDVAQGVGQSEELSAEARGSAARGRAATPSGPGPQSARRLPRASPAQRHPPVDDRARGPVVSEGAGPACGTELPRPRPDGSATARCPGHGDPGDGDGRAGGGPGNGPGPGRRGVQNAGRRSRIRHAGLRGRPPGPRRHSARWVPNTPPGAAVRLMGGRPASRDTC